MLVNTSATIALLAVIVYPYTQLALAFQPPLQHALASKSSTSHLHSGSVLSATADGGSDMPLPFFASVSEQGSAAPEVAGSTTVTTRLPLGTLFDSRDYIFNAATNVRGYEWTLKETDELFDDLSDVAIGEESPNKHRGDYELSQIVLVPMEWDRASYGLGGRYDVHDGQQRLVTLCLLFAALRESFRNENAPGVDETIEELTSMLNPPKVRKAAVLRIELRKRDNEMLRRILSPDLVDEGKGSMKLNILPPEDWKGLSLTNARILTNYSRLASRVAELTTEQRLCFLDYLIEHVYLLCCVPETPTIARNIVMAQGKGMNTEPIDDFKGLVCFRYTLNEEDMYSTFDKWDTLASMPDAEVGSVGRDNVASACLLRASAALQTKIRKNDEALALENWLRQDLIKHGYEGKEFYAKNIEPASRALQLYRDGSFDSFEFISKGGKETADLQSTIMMRLSFLRGLTTGIASAKEAEILVLDLLLKAEGDSHKALALDELDLCLSSVEICALWMAVLRPSPLQRHKRCFDILDILDSGVLLDDMADVVISDDEKTAVREGISQFEFGASPTGKKLAVTMLQRLNTQLLMDIGNKEKTFSHNFVEHILPTNTYRKYWSEQWPDEEIKDAWTHKIGNLALMSRKSTAKESNNVFGEKKDRYKKETAPLTQDVADIDTWNKYALAENHGKHLGLIGKIWGL